MLSAAYSAEELRELERRERSWWMPRPDPSDPFFAMYGPAPCDDCEFAARCRLGAACEAFDVYVQRGRGWEAKRREPSARIFNRLYPALMKRAA